MTQIQRVNQAIIDEFVKTSSCNFGKVRRLLLQYPELVDGRATWGETAVEAAVHAGQREIIALLLSAGAPAHECTGACKAKIERLDQDLAFH